MKQSQRACMEVNEHLEEENVDSMGSDVSKMKNVFTTKSWKELGEQIRTRDV